MSDLSDPFVWDVLHVCGIHRVVKPCSQCEAFDRAIVSKLVQDALVKRVLRSLAAAND